ERIHRIGQAEFDEIRTVLRQEKFLLPPRDDRTAYEEFAAVFLEMSFFAASLLPRYFPAIDDFSRILDILAEDVDAAAIFAAIRLAGAPEPTVMADEPEPVEAPPDDELVGIPHVRRRESERRYRRLIAHSERAAAAGNHVRAAIDHARAAESAGSKHHAAKARDRAAVALDRLLERLQHALQFDDVEAKSWRGSLAVLLPRAARGIWPAEARLLYDLQQVCV